MKKTLKERFDEKWIPEPNSGCWLWEATIDKDCYGRLSINKKYFCAHRISYELYCEPIPKGMVVCHKCDNPLCVNPEHLFIGTLLDNIKDMLLKGRQSKGTSKTSCVLTEKQVIEIFKDNRFHHIIAEEYGVTRTQISKIKRGVKWGWLTNSIVK